MRCKNCHYSLENLTEHRCPECGSPYDPSDPNTFITAADYLSGRRNRRFCALGFCGSMAFIGWVAYSSRNPTLLLAAIPGVVVVAIGFWNTKSP